MKKLLGIVVLGFLFYSSVSAKEYVCIQEAKKDKTLLEKNLINDFAKTRIFLPKRANHQ